MNRQNCRSADPNREFSFGVRGFPLRLAFAATTFKVQGLSLKDFTIADWTEAGQRHRRGEAYVALSRGEVRQAFHILQVFGKNLRDVFRPSNDLLTELSRLSALHEDTVNRLDFTPSVACSTLEAFGGQIF